MFIDTHAHIQFNAYKTDTNKVIQRSLDNKVALIAPSSQIDTSRRAVEYAEQWDSPYVWAAVGLHPLHLEDMVVDSDEVGEQQVFRTRAEEFNREAYEPLLQSKQVVAIGEIGLDYWRKPKSKTRRAEYTERQKQALIQQLDLARDYNLPVILHCRTAHDDLIEVVQNHDHHTQVTPPGVAHCYTGNTEQMHTLFEMGFMIGVNGLVFTLDLVESVAKNAPLDNILLETDAPYLSPPGAPERNEPMYIPTIAQKIADIKGVSVEQVEQQTTHNTLLVFKNIPQQHYGKI